MRHRSLFARVAGLALALTAAAPVVPIARLVAQPPTTPARPRPDTTRSDTVRSDTTRRPSSMPMPRDTARRPDSTGRRTPPR